MLVRDLALRLVVELRCDRRGDSVLLQTVNVTSFLAPTSALVSASAVAHFERWNVITCEQVS